MKQRALREPARTMHLVMTGIGAMIMLGICGLSSFFVIADERRGLGAPDTGTAAAENPHAISSRVADPEPLTRPEVFPTGEIRLRSGDAPYRVTLPAVDNDCGMAATGGMGALLERHGCSQVVRASMIAPYGGYRVTAGVFNLTDATSAAMADGQIRALIESGDGSFAAIPLKPVPGEQPRPSPDAQVGWHHRGHYLLFCVISRPDDTPITPDDPYAPRITADLLDGYLSGEILAARAMNA